MTDLYKPRPERWPQVRLSSIFFLVTVLCVWLAVQVKWITDRHKWTEKGAAIGNYEIGSVTLRGQMPSPWSISILGEPGYKTVILETRTFIESNKDSEYIFTTLRSLFPEAEIQLYGGPLIELPDPPPKP